MPSLMASLGLNATTFKAGLDRAVGAAAAAGNRVGSALGGALSNQMGQFASAAAAGALVKKIVDFGGEVQDMSDRLGISTDAVQEWDYALRMSGASIDQAAGFFQKLAVNRKKAFEGDEDTIASFKKLGVTVQDLKNKRLEDIGMQISQAFKGGDPQQLVTDLAQVGGKGAVELIAAFRNGFSEMAAEARNVGAIIDSEVIGKLDQAGDSAGRIWAQFRAGIAPAVAFGARMLEGLWIAGNKVMRGVVGFVTGGTKGANDLVNEYMQQVEERRAAEEARAGGNKSPVSIAEDEAKAVKKVVDLREQLFKAQQENNLQSLSAEQQVQELLRRRAMILQAMQATKSEEGRLNAALDIENLDAKIRGVAQQAMPKGQLIGNQANAMQKIGAYIGDPVRLSGLDVQKQSEKHLAEIKSYIAKMAEKTTGGTQF